MILELNTYQENGRWKVSSPQMPSRFYYQDLQPTPEELKSIAQAFCELDGTGLFTPAESYTYSSDLSSLIVVNEGSPKEENVGKLSQRMLAMEKAYNRLLKSLASRGIFD